MPVTQSMPVLPLRGSVVFPGLVVPIAVGRAGTLRAVESAVREGGTIFAVAQSEDTTDEPTSEQLHGMGVIAHISQIQRGLGGVQLLLQGRVRGSVSRYFKDGGFLGAEVVPVPSEGPRDPIDPTFEALHKEARERAVELGEERGLPEEVLNQVLESVQEPGAFADLACGYIELPAEEKQSLLETLDVEERLRKVLVHMHRQIGLLRAQAEIKSQVQEELGERQREMFLREQMRAIQKELGEDAHDDEISALREKLKGHGLGKQVQEEVDRELTRLERAGRESMEAQMIRTWLEWVADLPWNKRTDDLLDLKHASDVLDEDHYGLKDVKDRILEFLAVRQLKAQDLGSDEKARALAKGPILLFIGPPGVGKTSIAKSIARALGRSYIRASLGGVRDEADIRGHRRTYVGAMPGRIVQGMRQAGAKNPVFLLDEVDKLGVSFQGDPSSALLEVLDPAQNDTFTDHYLNAPFDLSEVLFIATANVAQTIPAPLLDRMELVEFSGYTEAEKSVIAHSYLVPRQLDEAGLKGRGVSFDDSAVRTLVASYTRESGVRQLERQIGSVARKIARRIASGESVKRGIAADDVRAFLGRPRVLQEKLNKSDEVGVATGMYYTPAGGDIMLVEAAVRRLYGPPSDASDAVCVTGWGNVALILTGQLGDVMKESARAALTYALSHASKFQIPEERRGSIEVHVHVPAGAIPKDGPSAGVAICTAIISALSMRPIRRELAMTGEITLRGHVLPIGGVKEKVLGAHRAGIKTVVLPVDNQADIEDIPDDVKAGLRFECVGNLEHVQELALMPVVPRGHPDRDADLEAPEVPFGQVG